MSSEVIHSEIKEAMERVHTSLKQACHPDNIWEDAYADDVISGIMGVIETLQFDYTFLCSQEIRMARVAHFTKMHKPTIDRAAQLKKQIAKLTSEYDDLKTMFGNELTDLGSLNQAICTMCPTVTVDNETRGGCVRYDPGLNPQVDLCFRTLEKKPQNCCMYCFEPLEPLSP